MNFLAYNDTNHKEIHMFQFAVDATLTVCTGGLWLIRVYCREKNK